MKMELYELTRRLTELMGVNSVDNLGAALLIAASDEAKMQAFSDLVEGDLSKDWLQMVYQYYQADRKEKKQDYTPKCLAQFLSRLIGDSIETIDMCAGSGALTIQRWVENPDTAFILYEIDENVIPYLIFNLAVRNITADIYRADVLQNEIYEHWKITRGAKYGKVVNIKSAL